MGAVLFYKQENKHDVLKKEDSIDDNFSQTGCESRFTSPKNFGYMNPSSESKKASTVKYPNLYNCDS